MADVINKQKKTRAQKKKAYYAAQFGITLRNKQRKIAKAARAMAKAAQKKARRAARNKRPSALDEIVRISQEAGLYDSHPRPRPVHSAGAEPK